MSTRGVADRLHSAAIHLLRRLRREDEASGISAAKLSALSVIVFGGPLTVSGLAAAEHVTPPTVSRLLTQLERAGLVRREPGRDDRRVVWIHATEKGKQLMEEGRHRRIVALEALLHTLDSEEVGTLAQAVAILERVLTADA